MKLLPQLARSGLLAFSLTAVAAPSAQAQVNINIVQPAWGPAVPAGTQYYYIPEVGGYYDLSAQRYVVLRDNKWTRVTALNGYNPGSFHPVVIDYRGAQPWVLIREHKVKYPKGGHPHGMPPGQAKKLRGYGSGNDRYERRDDDRYERHDDDHEYKDKNKDKGKGHGKGKH